MTAELPHAPFRGLVGCEIDERVAEITDTPAGRWEVDEVTIEVFELIDQFFLGVPRNMRVT